MMGKIITQFVKFLACKAEIVSSSPSELSFEGRRLTTQLSKSESDKSV